MDLLYCFLYRYKIAVCLLIGWSLFFSEISLAHGQEKTARPNIVFIIVDDLGWGDLGSYGNTFNETPNLDRLAASGVRFTDAYAAAPVCSPTRASIMTGLYPAKVRITDFLPEGWKTERFLDPASYTTLNEVLALQGYHTGIVGKWHLDTRFRRHTGSPKAHGFHEVIGSETKYIAGGDYFYPYDKINTYTAGEEGEYLTDRQSQDACDFIRRNKEKPFFLYLSYYSVHTRSDAPKRAVDKYKRKFDQKYGDGLADKYFEARDNHEHPHIDNPYLAAMLEHIDHGVGDVMKTLQELELDKNTLVVFISDNGGAVNVSNNGALRGHKTWLYEGGIRVPLLMSWPGVIPTETTVGDPVSTIDFYPTLAAASGAGVDITVDGVNLMPLFNKGYRMPRRPLYWHYPAETAKWTKKMATAVRIGPYKLIRFYEGDRYELYDLEKDISETENLVEREIAIFNELKRLMEQWKAVVNAEEPDLTSGK